MPEPSQIIASAEWQQCAQPRELFQRLCDAGADRRLVVRAACACARLALPRVPARESRPLHCIETTEAWCRGEATIDEVRTVRAAAAYACAAGAAAAYAACAAGGGAADAYAACAAYAADAADAACDAAYAAAAYAARAAVCAADAAAARETMRRRCCDAIRAVVLESVL